MDNSKTIQLKYPIDKGDGSVITTVKMGRFKVKHLKLLPGDLSAKRKNLDMKEILPLISGMTDIPESLLDEMDIDDLTLIVAEMEGLFPNLESRKTGEN